MGGNIVEWESDRIFENKSLGAWLNLNRFLSAANGHGGSRTNGAANGAWLTERVRKHTFLTERITIHETESNTSTSDSSGQQLQ